MIVGPLVAAVALACVHVFAGRLRFLDSIPRSHWLSVAGGVSVSYVFIHLLPALAAGQETVRRAATGPVAFLEHHVYLVALLGLVVFYGLEATAKRSRHRRRQRGAADVTSAGVFWLRIGSFAVYNALVGYLLVHREDPEPFGLVLFFTAMALHFVVNDYGLREDHKDDYRRVGRWVLAAAVLAGWAVGLATAITDVALAVLVAFLAGGVILNVLKEELPAERRSRFWAFAAGAAAYTALLLVI